MLGYLAISLNHISWHTTNTKIIIISGITPSLGPKIFFLGEIVKKNWKTLQKVSKNLDEAAVSLVTFTFGAIAIVRSYRARDA